MGHQPKKHGVPAPHGRIRALRTEFISPWLTITDARVLLALGDAEDEGVVDLVEYVSGFTKQRQAAAEHAKYLKACFDHPQDGAACVELDKLYQEHGALLPTPGIVGPGALCPVDDCARPEHPRCEDAVKAYKDIACLLEPDYNRLAFVAGGLLTVARKIAPDAVALCDRGCKAVQGEMRRVNERTVRRGIRVRLPKDLVPTRAWGEQTGAGYWHEWRVIALTRMNLKKLTEMTDDQLQQMFVDRAQKLRPKAQSALLENTFAEAVSRHDGPPPTPHYVTVGDDKPK